LYNQKRTGDASASRLHRDEGSTEPTGGNPVGSPSIYKVYEASSKEST
jgi:hypothetical protein